MQLHGENHHHFNMVFYYNKHINVIEIIYDCYIIDCVHLYRKLLKCGLGEAYCCQLDGLLILPETVSNKDYGKADRSE
jgi:hypothetical protein